MWQLRNSTGSQARTRRKGTSLDPESPAFGKMQGVLRQGFYSSGRQPEENQDRTTSPKERALCKVPLQSMCIFFFGRVFGFGADLVFFWLFSYFSILFWGGFFVIQSLLNSQELVS